MFEELIRQAAQAPLLHSDDTPMKVLSLMKERAKAEAGGVKPVAKAINTSGIVAVLQDKANKQRKVVLFFTGHAHAGKNMERVLAHRAEELQPAMQMCDALAANVAGEFTTILANCLAHGRRQLVDVAEQFPEAARHVVQALAEVYKHDAQCRQDGCSPEQRLSFHRQHSKPIMDELERWTTEQINGKQVEPNSGLGRALRYLIKHWSELTLFLREVGAPLDNNVCERALKRAIIHPRPAEPEPNKEYDSRRGIGEGVDHGCGGTDGEVQGEPARRVVVLPPDHHHRHLARGVLRRRDDELSVCPRHPHLRLPALCRAFARSDPGARAAGVRGRRHRDRACQQEPYPQGGHRTLRSRARRTSIPTTCVRLGAS